MANGNGYHSLKKSVGNAYVSRRAIQRQVLHIDAMMASAHNAFAALEMERLESQIYNAMDEYQKIDDGIPAMRCARQQVPADVLAQKKEKQEEIDSMIERYASSPCGYAGLQDAAFDDHVAAVQAHNNRFNNSSGHKFNHSSAWKKPRKQRAGRGFSFKPETPWLPSGAGNFFNPEEYDGAHGEVWDMELVPRYSRTPGSHPEQATPKIEWATERKWRNRNARRRKAARRNEARIAGALARNRKEIKWFTEPGLTPPKSFHSGWW